MDCPQLQVFVCDLFQLRSPDQLGGPFDAAFDRGGLSSLTPKDNYARWD